jgi:hypothetical protein
VNHLHGHPFCFCETLPNFIESTQKKGRERERKGNKGQGPKKSKQKLQHFFQFKDHPQKCSKNLVVEYASIHHPLASVTTRVPPMNAPP